MEVLDYYAAAGSDEPCQAWTVWKAQRPEVFAA